MRSKDDTPLPSCPPRGEAHVLEGFRSMRSLDVQVRLDDRIGAGIVFPAGALPKAVTSMAQFGFLRVARNADLRDQPGCVGSIAFGKGFAVEMPHTRPLNTDVACGGV
jgi:hypothetical protein